VKKENPCLLTAALALATFAANGPVFAHGFAGKRFFPATLTTDDPQSDQMQIRMWIGDDARHLPLRIAAVTQLGAVRADLVIVPAQ